MSLDRKLKKYASHMNNPKYYKKISDILLEAFEKDYQFESFNYEDLAYIHTEIDAFFDALQTEEEQKQMIDYCNKYWIIVSDKHYILCETPKLIWALEFYVKTYLILFAAKIAQLFKSDALIMADNVNKDIWLFRGALKACKFLGCSLDEITEYKLDL